MLKQSLRRSLKVTASTTHCGLNLTTYIPAQLQPVADQTGYLLLTQDPFDFSDNNPSTFTRETMRFVGGFEWEMSPDHALEVSVNHGQFTNTTNATTTVLDRTFAAFDAVEDANGNIVCRSDIDP